MNSLVNNIHEFIINDTITRNEFYESAFIANAKYAISKNADDLKFNDKLLQYSQMLEKAIKDFKEIKVDEDAFNDTMMKLNEFDKMAITIPIKVLNDTSEIVFKPQYLNQYINKAKEMIDDCVNKKMSYEDMVQFVANSVSVVEKQIVKSQITYTKNPQVLLTISKRPAETVRANYDYIETFVIPYVKKFNDIKNNGIVEATAVLNTIKDAENSVKAIIKVVNNVAKSNLLDEDVTKQLMNVEFNIINNTLEIIGFITFMMIYKLNLITANALNINNIYNEIFNVQNVSEAGINTINNDDYSSITAGFINGSISVFGEIAPRMYEYHADGLGKFTLGMDSETMVNYDKSIYDEIVKAYILINEGLNVIGKEGDEYLLVFDDIIKNSGFAVILRDRFMHELEKINDTTNYDSASSVPRDQFDNSVFVMMMEELKAYPVNMQRIANIIQEVYNKLMELKKRFDNNINGEFKDMETANEIKIFLRDLHDQFIEMTDIVSKNFINRLRTIAHDISLMDSSVEKDSSTVPALTDDSIDFAESVFVNDLEDIEKEFTERFNDLQLEYYSEKVAIRESANVVYEAEGDEGNTKVEITDNSQETQNQGQQANASSGGVNPKSILDSISKFLENIIAKITKLADNNKKNAEWINKNKDALLGRSYNNVAVKVLPYSNIKIEAYINNLNTMITNFSSLTPQNIQEFQNVGDVYRKLLSFVNGLNTSVTDENIDRADLTNKISTYLKVGSASGNVDVVTVANGELKNLISSDIIPYCTTYSTTFSDSAKDIGEKVKAGIQKLANSVSTTNVTEAEEPQKNTQSSMIKKVKWIETCVEVCLATTLDVARQRNNDYFKILNALVPKASTTGQANVSDGNDQQQNANQ